jgi:hypothetical protein
MSEYRDLSLFRSFSSSPIPLHYQETHFAGQLPYLPFWIYSLAFFDIKDFAGN